MSKSGKKRDLLIVLTALAVIVAAAAPRLAAQTFSIKNDVTVASGETQKNVFTLGGNAVVDGRVIESVVAVGGSITISGEVGQAVVGLGSRVVIKSTAVISGDIAAIGGTLEKEPGCTIKGDTVYIQSSEIGDRLFRQGIVPGLFSLSLMPFMLVLKLVIFTGWLVAGLIGAGLFPKPIASAASEIRSSFWSVFGVGILAVIVFTGLLIFSALLSIILIGIPVFLALLVTGFVVWVFGRLAVFYFFGDSLLRALGGQKSPAIGAVLLGLVVVSLVAFLPLFGFLVTAVLNIIGWGVVIRTKFGTKQNWLDKKPAPCPPAGPPAA
jgi:hypothetical protein